MGGGCRQVGAHDFPFEACSGFTRVAARWLADPPKAGRCPEGFSKSVTLLAASVATGANRQFPQAGLAPARALHLFTARRIIQAGDRGCPGSRRPARTLAARDPTCPGATTRSVRA